MVWSVLYQHGVYSRCETDDHQMTSDSPAMGSSAVLGRVDAPWSSSSPLRGGRWTNGSSPQRSRVARRIAGVKQDQTQNTTSTTTGDTAGASESADKTRVRTGASAGWPS